jgi:uncharacterized damage-inducible protein DinB
MRNTRTGGLGAMMDEYERAAAELTRLIQTLDDSSFLMEHPQEAQKCRSVQKIMSHVARAAYGYANDIRLVFNLPIIVEEHTNLENQTESNYSLQKAPEYTAATLEGKWAMSEAEIEKVSIFTPWGTTYTLEQMLEHAIVHILRHRRQIERLLNTPI